MCVIQRQQQESSESTNIEGVIIKDKISKENKVNGKKWVSTGRLLIKGQGKMCKLYHKTKMSLVDGWLWWW